MPPSLKAPWPTRHSMPYSTSPPMTLLSSSLFSLGFTQPFAPFLPGPPGARQVPLTPFRLPLLRNPPLSLSSSNAILRHKNLPLTFYMLRDSIISSSSFLPSSLMLFSPPSSFPSQKANDWLSTQITPFPLAYSEPTGQPPYSPTVPLPSISAEVHSLTETILFLEALLKERTLTSPSSQLSPPPQPSHPPLLSYHQADPHFPGPLPFPTPYTDGVPSYLPPGWPLSQPPTIFTPYWEQLQSSTFHLPHSTNSVEPILIPALASSTSGMNDHPHSPQVIPLAITIPTGSSDLGPIISAWCFMFQSTKHLRPDCPHHHCPSCGQTTPSHLNHKYPELHCSHYEQHGHF